MNEREEGGRGRERKTLLSFILSFVMILSCCLLLYVCVVLASSSPQRKGRTKRRLPIAIARWRCLARSVQQLFCSSPAPSLPPSLPRSFRRRQCVLPLHRSSIRRLLVIPCVCLAFSVEGEGQREGGALLCSGVAADAAEGRLAAAVFLLPSSLTPRETGLRATK